MFFADGRISRRMVSVKVLDHTEISVDVHVHHLYCFIDWMQSVRNEREGKMRLLVVLVCVAAFAVPAVAAGHATASIASPSTDDVIDTNAFNAAHLYGEPFGVYTVYWTADDFTASSNVEISKLTYWVVTSAAAPTSIDIVFWDDAAPGPGNELASYSVSGSDLTLALTGITVSGYPVYILEANLPTGDYFFAFGGLTYWTTLQRTSGGDLFAVMDDQVRDTECYRITSSGGPWVAGSTVGGNPPTDMFRIIEGQAASAFQESTWGAIKAGF
jgi:hypothetical protein